MVAPGIVLFDDVDAEHWTKRIIRNSNREIITSQTGEAMRKVAFICVHNSCRRQIAEALGKHLRGTDFDFYSAGVETKPQINQDAVRLMRELYGIDMEKTQYSKLISDIPKPDIAISMGCLSSGETEDQRSLRVISREIFGCQSRKRVARCA